MFVRKASALYFAKRSKRAAVARWMLTARSNKSESDEVFFEASSGEDVVDA